eukprot:7626407-Pyramimonas_sp.AAC.1
MKSSYTITSSYGSSCANNGKGALNSPDITKYNTTVYIYYLEQLLLLQPQRLQRRPLPHPPGTTPPDPPRRASSTNQRVGSPAHHAALASGVSVTASCICFTYECTTCRAACRATSDGVVGCEFRTRRRRYYLTRRMRSTNGARRRYTARDDLREEASM